jgi:pyruvate-formate lyase-activating enzyme
VRCGKCVDACPVSMRHRLSGALALPTREVSISELWELIHPQLDLLRDIGGITISGGEALLQSPALLRLLRLCQKDGIHTAIETSGGLPSRCFVSLADLVDCWLFGLRPTPLYRPPATDLIERNLKLLRDAGRDVIIRMPVVVGTTDLPNSLEQISKSMTANRVREIQLLPFHAETGHYYHAMGSSCSIGSDAIPSAERLRTVEEYFQRCGFIASIVQ